MYLNYIFPFIKLMVQCIRRLWFVCVFNISIEIEQHTEMKNLIYTTQLKNKHATQINIEPSKLRSITFPTQQKPSTLISYVP